MAKDCSKFTLSSTAFEFVEELIKHKINKFQDLMMDSELISMGLLVKGTPTRHYGNYSSEEEGKVIQTSDGKKMDKEHTSFYVGDLEIILDK